MDPLLESDVAVPALKSTTVAVNFWDKEKVESLLSDLKLAPGTAEYIKLVQKQDTSCSALEEEKVLVTKQPGIFFLNSDQQVLSIYRSVLLNKRTDLQSELELFRRVNLAIQSTVWVVILIGGGNFAGAVFVGPEPIVHKTFHSYTVRRKQGGSQSSKDNRSTNHPKSAGASLRRYNERLHKQHIQEIISDWNEHIVGCDLIFYRCPKSLQHILYDGKDPSLSKSDQRLRTIPFATKKASFAEVKKVHKRLSQITVHGKIDDLLKKSTNDQKLLLMKSGHERSTSSGKCRKSRKKLSIDTKASNDTRVICGSSTESEDYVESGELVTNMETLTLGHLNPYGSTVEDMKLMKDKRSLKEYVKEESFTIPSIVRENKDKNVIENAVYTSCRTGKLHELIALWEFSTKQDITEISDTLSNEVIEAILLTKDCVDFCSMRFGIYEKTLLHVAADNSQKDILWWLLERGFDPSIPNSKNETPYIAAKNKEVRNHFRRYMAAHPNQYNYEEAKIPAPLTKEMEVESKAKINLKKKGKKKAKQERDKQLIREEELKRKELEEKEKFLSLSDREKRALAAERRMMAIQQNAQLGSSSFSSTPILRCFQCAKDISSLIPFEYLDYKFCSTGCVKDHRNKSKAT